MQRKEPLSPISVLLQDFNALKSGLENRSKNLSDQIRKINKTHYLNKNLAFLDSLKVKRNAVQYLLANTKKLIDDIKLHREDATEDNLALYKKALEEFQGVYRKFD